VTEPRVVELTRAERRVVGILADDGPTDQQIADRLRLSLYTVRSHVKNALREASCSNRTELVCALLRRRIVIKTVKQRRRDP
jgi:DNA-binding NarL/FixJ family response regulator